MILQNDKSSEQEYEDLAAHVRCVEALPLRFHQFFLTICPGWFEIIILQRDICR